ncbi:DUF2877 domain-containing protein [Rummeliibacillus stabekisii]|uniref:DUF2877 domain-containing protein n=1 Tax=Rummeliibacillus stabekisii TaxID=241244 RepID=UPI001166F248|nr:DUF2877 domain-containing protein [Rummeliibacillus stabekisii]MBB5169347.1 hypothetical protein [Rummeliibacillus stabekisii]GEL03610.1 hypothetical protein RST01_02370 [Rummeliibacillus stabekisii]
MEWQARTISAEIHPILKNNPQGNVHSVFNNSFNLVFGEHLIHIGTSENGTPPFGITLKEGAQKLAQQVIQNEEVMWNSVLDALVLAPNLSISLKKAAITIPVLQHIKVNSTSINEIIRAIAVELTSDNWQTGLTQNLEDNQLIKEYILTKNFKPVQPILKELDKLSLLASGDESVEPKSVFDFWIGRGLGLTPSGDDLLTGLCAAITALGSQKNSFQKKLHSYLVEYGIKRTTSIALEYLMYATQGKFHSHLINMMQIMTNPQNENLQDALLEMKKLGHTSGTDTLLGMLLGIKALSILE